MIYEQHKRWGEEYLQKIEVEQIIYKMEISGTFAD